MADEVLRPVPLAQHLKEELLRVIAAPNMNQGWAELHKKLHKLDPADVLEAIDWTTLLAKIRNFNPERIPHATLDEVEATRFAAEGSIIANPSNPVLLLDIPRMCLGYSKLFRRAAVLHIPYDSVKGCETIPLLSTGMFNGSLAVVCDNNVFLALVVLVNKATNDLNKRHLVQFARVLTSTLDMGPDEYRVPTPVSNFSSLCPTGIFLTNIFAAGQLKTIETRSTIAAQHKINLGFFEALLQKCCYPDIISDMRKSPFHLTLKPV